MANTSVRAQPGTGAELGSSVLTPADPSVRKRPDVWQRFRRHRVAVVGAIILLLLAASSIAAPLLSGDNDPYKVDISSYRQGPKAGHLMGTDSSGRDVWSRLLYAGRVSLSVGVVAVAIYAVIGTILG